MLTGRVKAAIENKRSDGETAEFKRLRKSTNQTGRASERVSLEPNAELLEGKIENAAGDDGVCVSVVKQRLAGCRRKE